MFASLRTLLVIFLLTSLLACQALPGQQPAALPGLNPASRVQPMLRSQSQAQDWEQALRQEYQQVFAEHDSNRNGSIEPSEVAHAPRAFAAFDRNRDQRLSPAETLPEPRYLALILDLLTQPVARAPQANEDPRLELPSPQELARFRQEIEQHGDQVQTRQQAYPVLLVPGYAEPSWYFMYGIYRDLKKQGWAVEGLNLFPNFASAEEQALKVQARIEQMRQRYGVDKIDLVVHSFGGLISRYYIQEMGGTATVRNLVTIATPHHGTYSAYLGPGESAVQLRPDSDFLKKLNAQGYAYPPVRYTSIWSNVDEIVLPPSNAVMPDSEVHYVPWTGHLTIMFSQRTYGFVRQALLKP